MKKIIFSLAFMLIGSFAFANTGVELHGAVNNPDKTLEILEFRKSQLEYEFRQEGTNTTCYVRFCWNISETERKCSEWTEVPCYTKIEIESKSNELTQP